jgi:hypothetical protein
MANDAGTIEIKHGGERYQASYAVRKGQVHLLTPLGSVEPQPLGSEVAAEVAKAMLRKILLNRTKL